MTNAGRSSSISVSYSLDSTLTVDSELATWANDDSVSLLVPRIVNFVSDIEKAEKQELFRIKTISLNSWETTENEGWEKLLEDKTTVYAVRISDFGKQNGITHEVIQNEFKLIG